MRTRPSRFAVAAAAASLYLAPRLAVACGCFAPPSAATPVVQAGERILFAVKNDVVTMHVQIQYAGDGKTFGWIVPVPADPKVELGTDELFQKLEATTSPSFLLNRTFDSCGPAFSLGCAGSAAGLSDRGGAFGGVDMATYNPLVRQASLGAFDYAVLKADRKQEMLDWLAANRYFVPAGTDAAVAPYLGAGKFFLALKLTAGASTGDIQPIVLRYPAALPMIPIILTSVAAQPDMGIAVWILGASRAIPRNYSHVVVDDAAIDWLGQQGAQAANYGRVVSRAIDEAPDHHAFITQFAGPSSVMRGQLPSANRYGTPAGLYALTDAADYGSALVQRGFTFNSALVGILGDGGIPMPDELVSLRIAPADYYAQIDYYRKEYPKAFEGITFMFDATKLTEAIWDRVVKPAVAAGGLFEDYPYLTYLYTTLSPEEMTADPVFSWNPDLADVPVQRAATYHQDCDGNGELRLPSGLKTAYPDGQPGRAIASLPAALRVERLRESGQPEIVTDNTRMIELATGGGCTVTKTPSRRWGSLGLLAAIAALAIGRGLRRRGR